MKLKTGEKEFLHFLKKDKYRPKNKKTIYKDIRVFSATRLRSCIVLLIIIPLGFASKFYSGPGAWWFNNYACGIFYEIFWCFAVILFLPYASAFWVACSVLAATCSLEFLQLWSPPFLESVRSTFIGSALIGTTFVWWDFPHYVIGCFAGWLMIKLSAKNKDKKKTGNG